MEYKDWILYNSRKSKEELSNVNSNVQDTFNPSFMLHNKFAQQSLYNNLSAQYFNQNGVQVIYYVSSISKAKKIPFIGTQTQNIERSFHTKIQGDTTIQPEMIKFAKFGATGLDTTKIIVHRELFFKHNMRSLQENGIAPLLDPSKHNPWVSQRGYADFNYMGYSAEQIFPKAGDLVKPEWIETLYVVDGINPIVTEMTFMQRNYYFGLTIREYHDDHRDISSDLLNDSSNTEGYIENKFDQSNSLDVGNLIDNGPVTNPDYEDTSKFWETMNNKDDVLFRPDDIPPEVKNITNDKRYGRKPFQQW